MPVTKDKIQAGIVAAAEPLLQPGEHVEAAAYASKLPNGLHLTVFGVMFARGRGVVLTDRRLLMLPGGSGTMQRVKSELSVELPRDEVTVRKFKKPGLSGAMVVLDGPGGPWRLRIMSQFADEWLRITSALTDVVTPGGP